jgi:ribonucleoside-diphosphate reductase beta chain
MVVFLFSSQGLHTDFAVLMHSTLERPADEIVAREIVRQAVEIERQFVSSALPVSLIGMNADLMCEYIQFVADRLLKSLNFEPIYNTANPFDFMELISLQGKTNFFEKRVGEYQKNGVMSNCSTKLFSLIEDF